MTYLERRFPVRWRRMDGIKHSAGRVDETPTPEAEFRQMAEAERHRRHSAVIRGRPGVLTTLPRVTAFGRSVRRRWAPTARKR
jgi:hypothetical protein